MNIKPIKTKKDYEQAMLRLEKLFDAKKGTSKGDELEVISILVEKYEDEHFPINLPDPVEAIKFRMEQLGMTQTDLANIVSTVAHTYRGFGASLLMTTYFCQHWYCQWGWKLEQ